MTLASTKTHFQTLLEALMPGLSRTAAESLLAILFLSEVYAGSTHDKRIADATPYPLPAGSRLLQDLGSLRSYIEQR